MDALNKLKVVDLKKMLKEKGLATDGSKAYLIKRLLASGEKGASDNDTSVENLDTDEDLILGTDLNNDEAAEETATKKSGAEEAKASAKLDQTVTKSPTIGSTKIFFKPETEKTSAVASAASKEMLQGRIKRFGLVSEDVKKKTRAERFEMTSPNSTAPTGNGVSKNAASASVLKPSDEVLKKRAERFGVSTAAVASSKSGGPSEDVLKKKRAERFGAVASSSPAVMPSKSAGNDALLKRKARFSTPEVEGMKEKRAKRFGVAAS